MSQTVQFCVLGLCGFLFLIPLTAAAQEGNLDAVANAQCAKEELRRSQVKPKRIPPAPNPPFKCEGPHTTGTCIVNICKATAFKADGGQAGGSAGLDQVMKALGELFGKLMQQPPAPPTPPSTPSTFPGDNQGCQGTRFSTHDINLISNPCADYTPETIVISPTTTDPEACPPLSQALGLCTQTPHNCPDVPVAICVDGTHPVSGGTDENGCVKRDTCEPDSTQPTTPTAPVTTPAKPLFFSTTTGTFVMPPGGARGDINARPVGATVVAGSRDTQGNVEVAGFFGGETFSGQGGGLVASWCKSRPWASNFLGKIITPTFFDNICKSRGYQVGTPPPPPAVTLQQTKKPAATTATTTTKAKATTTTPTVPPKVDIWAVPASVPLGGRTSIFWNTQGVTSCTETSPNGGFSQNSLSGGAATQPITTATTFSISCLAPDGSPVTASVTVNLKI